MYNHRVPKHIQLPEGVDKIVTCLKSHGEKCPICDESWRLYSSDVLSEKQLGKSFNKGTRNMYNVYIVEDPSDNGKNVGQMKVWSAGKKLQAYILKEFGKLNSDIFNPENGYNLELEKSTDNIPDYSASSFSREKSKVIALDDLKDKLTNLDSLVDKPTIEDMLKSFAFLGLQGTPSVPTSPTVEPPVVTNTPTPTPKYEPITGVEMSDDEEDPELAKLINGI